MQIIERLWNSPLGITLLTCVIGLAMLLLILICTVLNVPGFKPKLDFNKDRQIRAVPPTAQYRAPIAREGDIIQTTSLPRRGVRQNEEFDDERY